MILHTEFMGKKILFSEGHGEAVRVERSLFRSFLSAFSRMQNPFESLESILMRFNYSFGYLGAQTLSLRILRKYDILIIFKPTIPYSPTEIQAVEKFVQLGGSALFIGQHVLPVMNLLPANLFIALNGDWKSHEHLNNISRKFGIFFITNQITSGKDKYSTQIVTLPIPIIKNFEPHPVFKKIDQFYYQGSSIDVTQEASPIAFSSKDTKPPSAIVMAISEYGDGRVLATGSPLIFVENRYNDLGIRNPQHAQLVLNIFTWLSHETRSMKKKAALKHPSEKICSFCSEKNAPSEIFCRACGNAI